MKFEIYNMLVVLFSNSTVLKDPDLFVLYFHRASPMLVHWIGSHGEADICYRACGDEVEVIASCRDSDNVLFL